MRKILLQRFQGHDNSAIELADTITAITGKTNHGKTSIIRAIKFVKDNRPAGNKVIKNGADSTKVTIDDVTHEKSKSVDAYRIEGHKQPFKALRGAVPEEITRALNLGPENLQEQLDSIFLLNESSGKVAQKLSELSDLDVTVAALQFIKTKKSKVKTDMDILTKSIEATEVQLHNLRHTASMDNDLSKLEAELASIGVLIATHDNLHIKYKNAVSALSELKLMPSVEPLEPAKAIVQQYEEIKADETKINSISKMITAITALEKELKVDPSKLLKMAGRVKRSIEDLITLEEVLYKTKALETVIVGIKEDIKIKESRKTELMGDNCPLCGK